MQFGFYPERKRKPWQVLGRGKNGSVLPLGESSLVVGVGDGLNREKPEAGAGCLRFTRAEELKKNDVRMPKWRHGPCLGGEHFPIKGKRSPGF